MIKTGVGRNIACVENVGGYKLKLCFSDGREQVVDFEPFLAESQNPETRRFLDSDAFGAYRIEWGNLVWGDYEMCFPIEDLYTGRLSAKRCLAIAEGRASYDETTNP